MKKLLLTFTLLCALFFRTAYSQSGWSWQNPTVTGNTLYSLKMVNDNTGYACGNAGTVIKTTNNGLSWITLNTGTSVVLNSIYFVDVNIGYACGNTGKIFKTIDGGLSWDVLPSGAGYDLYALQFINTNTGYAAGESQSILKTTNAGQSWASFNTGVPVPYNAIYFVDENTGFAVGMTGAFVKTTNGGASWQFLQIDDFLNLLSVYFINADTGFVGDDDANIKKTTDGGVTWEITQLNNSTFPDFNSIYFTNDNTGYICGGSGDGDHIYKTTNMGTSWTEQNSSIPLVLYSVSFSSPENGMAVGQDGNVAKTTDGGANWQSLKKTATNNILTTIFFSDPDTGYAVSFGTIIKTTNGGASWNALTHPAPNFNSDGIFFINGTTGVIGGEQNNIWRTTNGGFNWTAVHSDLFGSYVTFYFTNSLTGYAGNGLGHISKTTDAGVTWTGILTASAAINDIKFKDQNTGFAVGSNGTVLKTTNAGANWVAKPTPSTDMLVKMDYYGDTCIAVGGIFAAIYRSTDNGETWASVSSPLPTEGLTGVDILDNTTAYATTGSGIILKSTDAGLTWSVTVNIGVELADILFTPEGKGYVTGSNGAILQKDESGDFISGDVNYEGSGQAVTAGKVLALQLNRLTNEVLVVGSGKIQPNGKYIIPNLHGDTTYIVAYPNSDLDFVPTYYPSSIDWHTASVIIPSGSLENININVYPVTSSTGSGTISGEVRQSIRADSSKIDYALIYAKLNGAFVRYAASISNGDYSIRNLPNGTYQLFANRLGYENQTLNVTVSNSGVDTNIYMSTNPVGISQNGNIIPEAYELKQNYPNPFNPVTTISFSLPAKAFVKLNVYDVTGRMIASLINTQQDAGKYNINFDGSRLSSGVYFYRLEAGSFIETKRMMLIK